eukprot:comp22702_c2_seq1/m.35224 comp22702_c2_seq1/g.35224  ORF comp22702_c2_seq1/g.35224 comp22702_c2_seq1/m.35224 type:complete len:311 (-) comp22702_c2_seq1:80-1012(-)
MQPLDVAAALQAHQAKQLSIEVDKDPLTYDLGNLAAFDTAPLDNKLMKADTEAYLKALSRDNCQLLINQIWQLPVERREDAYVCELPAPTTHLPREKPIPQPKAQTKWEKFAEAKGIQKRKKSRMVFDEERQDWAPRWGYNRANDETKDWIKVLPDNKEQDPYEDMYAKALAAKKERINKNARQQQRNMQAAGTAPKPVAVQAQKKANIEKKIVETKSSTASIGRFDQQLKNEPKLKGVSKGKKRQYEPVAPSRDQRGDEKAKAMRLMEKVLSKDTSIIDTNKAANKALQGQQKKAAAAKKQGGKRKGKK